MQHILSLLRNAIPPPAPNEPFKRLPTFTTLLLSHALRSIFYPYQFMYPITARFLLQRPEIDTSDVPMLFGLLYSSSDEWRRERTWMINLLSDGLVGSDDWKVFKRRHTWDLLASIFQSSPDRALRRSIFEVQSFLGPVSPFTDGFHSGARQSNVHTSSSFIACAQVRSPFMDRDAGHACVR